jgi:Protein of unknown function (DUF3455)
MKIREVVAILAVSLAGCSTAEFGVVPVVPNNLNVPATQQLTLATRATGVQIYACRPNKDDAARFAWVLEAPEADLFDATGTKIGKHYAGPTWEASDGSRVVGEAVARDDGPDSNAIPWLLLRAKSTAGTGVLGTVTSVQRLRTAGGKAPANGCSTAHANEEVRVAYSAMYYFYVAGP